MAPSAYELKRQANIEQNRKLLMSLALHTPFFEPTEKTTRYVKRKAKADQDEASEQPPAKKRAKVDVESTDNGEAGTGVRRSSRNAGKTADYNAEITRGRELPIAVKAGIRTLSNNGPQGREDGKRLHDPKTYGAIPGVEVGTWWETRQGCSSDAIHAPWVAGIAPGPKGAYSVALSGGYDDDVDLGYAFTYTGSGGRDLKGTKTAPKNLLKAATSRLKIILIRRSKNQSRPSNRFESYGATSFNLSTPQAKDIATMVSTASRRHGSNQA
ncbi:hypothetical protein HGRIS_007881 [Hohenbuehelia grisea]|uniref:YDG domain-containing protein n=1 Tax=Hohenbuehelia grisea TaxID=104357 RepID=A0ABR3J6G1_9AGAR